MDRPMHPSIAISMGITSSRTCAIPASIDIGAALIVVERAYTIHPPYAQGSAPAAPPVGIHTAPPTPAAQGTVSPARNRPSRKGPSAAPDVVRLWPGRR